LIHREKIAGANHNRLRVAVFGSLFIQVVLSFALLVVTHQMDQSVLEASAFDALVSQQNRTFHETSTAIDVLNEAVEEEVWRVGFIEQVQRRISDINSEARGIAASLAFLCF
jgi:hypothetical protein